MGIRLRPQLHHVQIRPRQALRRHRSRRATRITATVTVTNTSTVAGDEVVEAYLKTPQADGPIHSLAGFQRVNIAAGAKPGYHHHHRSPLISSVDDKGNRAILEGKYTLTLGGAQPQDTDAKSEAAFTVTGTLPLPK